MEAMLKLMIANHKIPGLPDQLAEIKKQQHIDVDRMTMGSLVDKLFRSVVVDGSVENGELNASDGAASVLFSIELEAEAHSVFEKHVEILSKNETL